MNLLLTCWMPRIGTIRHWLTLAMVVVLGFGWYLTQPSAPIATWDEGDSVQNLTMAPPHTLVVSMGQKTVLFPDMYAGTRQTFMHQGTVQRGTVAMSADGLWLVVATVAGSEVHALRDGIVEIWSVANQQIYAQIPVPLIVTKQYFYAVSISPNGQWIGWITYGAGISRASFTVWDRLTQTVILTRTIDDPTNGFGLRVRILLLTPPEPRGIYVGNSTLEVRQLRDDVVQYRTITTDYPDTLSPDASLWASGSGGSITIWRVSDGQLCWRLPIRQYAFPSTQEWDAHAVFSSDAQFVITAASVEPFHGGLEIGAPSFWKASTNEPALLWDMRTGQVVQRFAVQPDGATKLAYSPDGQYVATAGRTSTGAGEIRVFRVQAQLPYLQPLSLTLGMLLLLALVVLPWLRLRR